MGAFFDINSFRRITHSQLLSRLSNVSKHKQNMFETLFRDQFTPVAGENLVEFGFSATADGNQNLQNQLILFDLVLACILPRRLGIVETGGSDSGCVLLDTESSFSILDFAVFVENFLSANHPQASKTDIIDQILSRLYVVSARTVNECILAVWNLREFMDGNQVSLFLIDTLSACFGSVPIKEFAISQKVFFHLLKHVVDRFNLFCVICRITHSTGQESGSDAAVSFAFNPTHRVHFSKITKEEPNKVCAKLFEGEKKATELCYYKFSNIW